MKAGTLINLGGYWVLQQNAVDIRVVVQLIDFGQQLFGGGDEGLSAEAIEALREMFPDAGELAELEARLKDLRD